MKIEYELRTDHNLFHAAMEQFWDLFRKGGAKFGQVPSNKEVLAATENALSVVIDNSTKAKIFAENEIDELVSFAEKVQVGYGYHDGPGGNLPTILASTNANI